MTERHSADYVAALEAIAKGEIPCRKCGAVHWWTCERHGVTEHVHHYCGWSGCTSRGTFSQPKCKTYEKLAPQEYAALVLRQSDGTARG